MKTGGNWIIKVLPEIIKIESRALVVIIHQTTNYI
jgi:hypothetical protein